MMNVDRLVGDLDTGYVIGRHLASLCRTLLRGVGDAPEFEEN